MLSAVLFTIALVLAIFMSPSPCSLPSLLAE
jgi:hypothetical protein